jgi:hypothetical protein
VVYDCGLLGEGSHSHYDVFNFCLYAGGAPLIVDPGRYTYSAEVRDGIDWRHWFKSTAAHNTVTIDGHDQTRYLSRTKHGPDAQVRDREFLLGGCSDWIRAKVISQEYAPVHERFFLYMHREYLWIVDRIDPADGSAHEAVLRFHLPEQIAGTLALRGDSQCAEMASEALLVHVQSGAPAESRIEPGWVSVSYGTKAAAPVLAVSQRSAEPTFFASAVVPTQSGNGPEIVAARHDSHVVTDIWGTNGRGPFHDTIVTAFANELARCEISGVMCRVRDLAVRRDSCGRVTYVVASGAEEIEVDGVPLEVGNGTVEWSREVQQ